MAYTYQIYPQHRLGIVRFSGSVTGSEITRAMVDLFCDDRWVPGFSAIWHLRGIDDLIVQPEDTAAVVHKAEQLRECIGGGKAAVTVHKQMDRMIALVLAYKRKSRRQRKVQLFHSLDEARAWLEVDARLDSLVERLETS